MTIKMRHREIHTSLLLAERFGMGVLVLKTLTTNTTVNETTYYQTLVQQRPPQWTRKEYRHMTPLKWQKNKKRTDDILHGIWRPQRGTSPLYNLQSLIKFIIHAHVG